MKSLANVFRSTGCTHQKRKLSIAGFTEMRNGYFGERRWERNPF
jgi:hypothetical protein